MKGAIASVEIYAWTQGAARDASSARPRRLTLVVGTPTRHADGDGWRCRVGLADLKRPVEVTALDSIGALSAALAQGEQWLSEMREEGFTFTRDRAGDVPYAPESAGSCDAESTVGNAGRGAL